MRRADPDLLAQWVESELDVRSRHGDELVCVCPFHQDAMTHKPDLYVNVRKGVFVCMSTACGERGTGFDLVAKFTGIPLNVVAAELSLGGRRRVQAIRERLSEARLSSEVEEPVISQARIDSLRSNRYWATERGLDPATCDAFELGFDDDRQCAVIPYRDRAGVARYLIRRNVLPNAAGPRYLYSKGFPLRSAIFNLYRIDPTQEVVAVEGSVDAMKIWQAGYTNVIALLGSGVFEQQLAAIAQLRIVTFFDRDAAGAAATRRMAAHHRRIFRVARYPTDSEAKDPDGLSPEQIQRAIERAVPSTSWTRTVSGTTW